MTGSERKYWIPDHDSPVTANYVAAAGRETQKEIMREWFFEHFDNPAENSPYESEEGGYIYIWGGPYDASEELSSEFVDIVPEDVIDELVSELNGISYEWSGKPSREEFDNLLIKDIASLTAFLHKFQYSILDINELLDAKVDSSVEICLNRLLYVNVITALETYLSDAFISTVLNSPGLMRRFIETTPEFQNEKVPVSEVFVLIEKIEKRAHEYLMDVVWHHLERVKPMYKDTLGIEFPKDRKDLFQAILVRHDIIHRNGKTKKGKEHEILQDDVRKLISIVEDFVCKIDGQLSSLKSNESSRLG